jgi:HEAT repeat protein
MLAKAWLAIICAGLLLSRAAAQAPEMDWSALGSQTLGATIQRASYIAVLQVEKVDRDRRVITYKKVADLKGTEPATTIDHALGADISEHQREQVLEWARPGRTAICFRDEDNSDTCLGNCWYASAAAAPGAWQARRVDDNAWAYAGPIEQLREHVVAILAGKQVVVTATALQGRNLHDKPTPVVRDWPHGKKGRIWRVKASLQLIDSSALKQCPGGYFVGWGVGGPEAVPGLVAALKHDDARVRAEAAEDLGQLSPPATAAVLDLRAALADRDGYVRVFAAEALARIEPDNEQTVPVLLAGLDAKQRGVCAAAVSALLARHERVPGLVTRLVTLLREDADAYTRTVTAFALGRLAREGGPAGSRGDVVKALGQALRQDEDGEVRRRAAGALLSFGPDARPAVPELRAALQDRSEDVAGSAASVLSRLGDDGSSALAEALGEKNCPVRGLIADLLGDLGPHSKALAPVLTKALEDDDASVRYLAAEAILRIDRPVGARLGVPVLARLAADKSYDAREYVIEFLGEIGADARAAVPTLIEILKEPGKAKYRRYAAEALGRIGPDARAAVPALIEALDSNTASVVDRSVEALGRIGPDARAALPALRARLAKAEWSGWLIRLAVALARIGDKGGAANVLLTEGLHGKDRWHREQALRALAEVGPGALAVVPALKEVLAHEDEGNRRWIAFAVWRIARPFKSGTLVVDQRREAVDALTELVRRPHPKFGLRGTVEVVQELGPAASPLVPALIAVLKDRNSREHDDALDALAAIGHEAAEAIPVLEVMLKQNPERIRVAVTLAHLGRSDLAVSAIPHMVKQGESVSSPREFDLYDILYGLKSLGAEARPAVPFLLRLMRHDDRSLYVRAAGALLVIDPEAAAKAGVYDAPRPPQNRQTFPGWGDDD